MAENSGLIILEKSMNNRFEAAAHVHRLPVFKANLDNNYSGHPVRNIIARLGQKSNFDNTVNDIVVFVEQHQLNRLYFASAEGFVSHNIIYGLKKRLKKVEMIALQHGVFPLKHSRLKEYLRKTCNYLTRFIFGLYPFGAGFGGILLHEYYVYSEREREYLRVKKGWSEKAVRIVPEFMKADIIKKFQELEIEQSKNNAIFLSQCLNLAGLCSLREEKRYTEKIIKHLALKYDVLFVKGHPSCTGILDSLDLPSNVSLIDDMLWGFSKCKTAFSFFSTALIDAKIFNLTTIGIVIEQLNVDREIYKNFDLNLTIEELANI